MRKITNLIIILLTNLSVFSQNAEVEIRNIFKDSTDSNKIYYSISLKVKDLELDEYHQVGLLEAKGIEENGNNLNVDKWYTEDYKLGLEILTEPMINEIKKLDYLEGKFKYFLPTLKNKSIIHIDNFKEKFNSNLLYKKSKQSKAILLNIEEFKKLSTDSIKYKVEIEKIEKNLKTPKNSIFYALKQFYKDYSFPEVNYKKIFAFYCEDNKEEILKINLIDELSNCFQGGYGVNRLNSGKLVVLHLLQVPRENCKLEFIIENKDSVKIYNFRLTDIDFDKYKTSNFDK